MSKRKELNIETRTLIIARHQFSKSNRQIAKGLNLNNTTVDYVVKKYRESSSFMNKARSVRPRSKTFAEDRAIVVVISKRNQRVTTVKRRLYKADLYGQIAMKKTVITHRINGNG